MPGEPVWCMVMFDLPTKTKQERRAYQGFRRFLLDNGFSQIQFSVYAWYSPAGHLSVRLMKGIKNNLPPGGEVRIYHITDRQWATAVRFSKAKQVKQEEAPAQLTLF